MTPATTPGSGTLSSILPSVNIHGEPRGHQALDLAMEAGPLWVLHEAGEKRTFI